MPIAVQVVSPEKFDAWASTAATDLDAAYKQLAATPDKAAVKVASTQD